MVFNLDVLNIQVKLVNDVILSPTGAGLYESNPVAPTDKPSPYFQGTHHMQLYCLAVKIMSPLLI